ncbi:glycosyltransferase family 4 protein [Shewanella sp. 4_MG-2023]|uniref:glycosyltransferase family 4 protein n=1 Tax=Shewanella sp. 4_MG-2023 TaxID=3062652 RepID=UPI0026E392DC|nr:glycosyltransferase family 4 protein [Shewanella sp. 4_MG-2023]MDO6678459.1 glycosyltransferase family 4 protein [Shewanella sp. 4_MG-2023]
MNILQICYAFPPSFSGYGKQLNTVNCDLLSKHPIINIDVITAYKAKKKLKNNYNIHSFYDYSRLSVKNEKYFFYIYALFNFLKFFKLYFKADVIHVVKAGPECIIPVVFSKIFNKKVIIKVAQDEMKKANKSSFFRKIRIGCVKKANKIIAISSEIEDDLIFWGVDKSSIVKVANSVLFKEHEYKDLHSQNGMFKLTFVGAICKRKGIQELLDCLLSFDTENIMLHVVLAGPDYGEILDLNGQLNTINKSNQNVSIEYLGKITNVDQILASSDGLILPSYSEGMPNVVLEAFSLGKPVLASNIKVHEDMINKKNGLIFRLAEEADLKEKLNLFINSKFCREEIINDSKRLYSVQNISDKYYNLYSKIIIE